VEFEAIDTEATPEAMQVLAKFSIPRAPAVIVGEQAVHGWNPQAVAELVGVEYDNAEKLSCEQMAERLDRILAAAQRADAYDGMCETYYGPQAATELFERTVWHAAQHLRQVYVMLETLGVTPDRPLTEADYTGLPLPDSIW
jgi:hypothetical protein